ncbi:MAG: hypothetical protein NUW24_13780 [Anaerolineae bacterium]|jgi:hypothetical protein|nr:hypothetical protein [Anaerolineae bacterium]MDH7474495.1 hypothetical protein [Anaerolineae bacterium]
MVDEVAFWGMAYACLLAAAGAYIVALWRRADQATLVGRVTGALGVVLMMAGLAIRLIGSDHWLPVVSSEVTTATLAVAIVLFLIWERQGKLQWYGAGIFVLVVLLDSLVLRDLVMDGQTKPALTHGGFNILDLLSVWLRVVAGGCLLVGGGLGLMRLIPMRRPLADRESEGELDSCRTTPAELSYVTEGKLDGGAWRAFVWGISALSGSLIVSAVATALAGRDPWAAESGLLRPLATWAVCAGTVAVERARGWRASLALLAAAVTCITMLSGGG